MIDKTKKVWVYFNLHKKCFSVMQNGVVGYHTHYIKLSNVTFVVRPAGHAKVRKEKRKNVHAFVKGYVFEPDNHYDHFVKGYGKQKFSVSYNPYKYDSFVAFNENSIAAAERVDHAEYVVMEVGMVELAGTTNVTETEKPIIDAYGVSQSDGTKLQICRITGIVEKV